MTANIKNWTHLPERANVFRIMSDSAAVWGNASQGEEPRCQAGKNINHAAQNPTMARASNLSYKEIHDLIGGLTKGYYTDLAPMRQASISVAPQGYGTIERRAWQLSLLKVSANAPNA